MTHKTRITRSAFFPYRAILDTFITCYLFRYHLLIYSMKPAPRSQSGGQWISRHPFFDTREGVFCPRARVGARLFLSCRTMQRKPFFEGMGSVGATRRGRLRNVKVPQKWGSRLIPAASVSLRGLCPALKALAARGRHRSGAPFSLGLSGDSECLRTATTRVCRCTGRAPSRCLLCPFLLTGKQHHVSL